MCKRTTIILLFFINILIGYAQVPEKLSYQAVIRDFANNLVANQDVGIQVSILKNGTPDTSVYAETHAILTNANGLISYKVGEGTVVSGNFASIDWADGTYSIKTETDPAGGTNYSITATSSFTSVPYALQAKTATNLGADASASLNPSKCNCDAYIIPYIPYGPQVASSIRVTNTPASWFGPNAPIVGDSEIRVEAIDEEGNIYTSNNIIGIAEVGKVTDISTELFAFIVENGNDVSRNVKISFKITLSNPQYAFINATFNVRDDRVNLDVQCIRF
ncbi:hypothetical protein [uncultured Polaribacter sp.]|uniref:hypothetical protein n=1 Tax=uncultured Polaribacter sp. TaxID=174711 RepID=UPI0026272A81|nr:hypothetical protein [uncultured Polaribacter sp.]